MENKKTILVIDDEASMRRNVRDVLSMEGYILYEAADGEEGIALLKTISPSLILLDYNLPQTDGITVLGKIKQLHPEVPVIIFTAFSTNERVIEAMKNGAYDYIEKPFELDDFLLSVQRAVNYAALINEVKQYRTEDAPEAAIADAQLVGRSGRMREVFKMVGRAASSDATILIEGESGTGKELIADAIQRYSLRKDKPYVKVNCGALAESLLESEIFGHEKGSFTGAIAQKPGKFEIANGGTIFLDEINNMPHSLQIRLLRVLQNKSFYRVGGETPISVDVRVIAATNKNIESEVEEGRFRRDLFYRLNVIRIYIPPLRERAEDIRPLTDHFISKYSPVKKYILSEETAASMLSYSWPGNVRELENMIQRGIVISNDNMLRIQLPDSTRPKESHAHEESGLSFHEQVARFEKELILTALRKTGGNKSEAAKLLGVHRRLLYNKIKELDIE